MKPFLFSILLAFIAILPLPAAPTPQQAWVDGFWRQLPEEELATKSPSPADSELSAKLPHGTLLPCPNRQFLRLDGISWIFSTLILLAVAVFEAYRLYQWHQSPFRRKRRHARNRLRQWLLSGSDELPPNLLPFLKEAFDRPDCANLLQLADAVEKKHPAFAESLRKLEHNRFSSPSISPSILSNFRKHLGKLLSVIILLCLGACSTHFHSKWYEAIQLAEEGRLQQSLDIFLELSRRQSSWQLSKNIAILYSHLNVPQKASAWNMHNQVQMAAYRANKPWGIRYAPELLLPLSLACLCLAFSCHNRRLLYLMLSFICIVSFITTVQPRFRIAQQVIVSTSSALLPIPDTTVSPAVHLMELPVGSVAYIIGRTTINDCIQIEYNHTHGWLSKQDVLFFMPQ